jgi:vacuolar protein sorting-associated protein VTA1
VDGELFDKQRYCAWRAAEIRKALREGRTPSPPPSAQAAAGGADVGGLRLGDLPPASGSSDWAYG